MHNIPIIIILELFMVLEYFKKLKMKEYKIKEILKE